MTAALHALAEALAHVETLRLLDELLDARADRQRRHLEAIEKRAGWAGREVGAGRMTLADAEAAVQRLVERLDDDSPVMLRLVPFDVGVATARRAFRAGLESGQRQLLQLVTR